MKYPTFKVLCPECDNHVAVPVVPANSDGQMQCITSARIDNPYCPHCEHEFTMEEVEKAPDFK